MSCRIGMQLIYSQVRDVMRFSGVWHAKAFELRLVRKKSLYGLEVEIFCSFRYRGFVISSP